jgi:hypothetical protein
MTDCDSVTAGAGEFDERSDTRPLPVEYRVPLRRGEHCSNLRRIAPSRHCDKRNARTPTISTPPRRWDREALEKVLGARLDEAKTLGELRDRLAYVIYGQTLFGVGALALAEQPGGLSRREAVAALGKVLDVWLAKFGCKLVREKRSSRAVNAATSRTSSA